MRQRIRTIIRKEFRQVFRNPAILRSVLIMPFIQLLVFPFAANYEVKNVLLSIVGHDHSPYSQKFISKITASGYFLLTDYSPSFNKAIKGELQGWGALKRTGSVKDVAVTDQVS